MIVASRLFIQLFLSFAKGERRKVVMLLLLAGLCKTKFYLFHVTLVVRSESYQIYCQDYLLDSAETCSATYPWQTLFRKEIKHKHGHLNLPMKFVSQKRALIPVSTIIVKTSILHLFLSCAKSERRKMLRNMSTSKRFPLLSTKRYGCSFFNASKATVGCSVEKF